MYTLTLKNGSTFEFSDIEGTNYVSATKVDDSQFTEENLAKVTLSDGTTENEMTDLMFVQQIEHEGKYLTTFRDKTEREKMNEALTDLQVALAEVYESMMG